MFLGHVHHESHGECIWYLSEGEIQGLREKGWTEHQVRMFQGHLHQGECIWYLSEG